MGGKYSGNQGTWEPRDFSEDIASKQIYLQAEWN